MLNKSSLLILVAIVSPSYADDLDSALNAVKMQQQQYNIEQDIKRQEAQKRAEIKAEKEAARIRAERAAAEAKAERKAAEAKAERDAAEARAEKLAAEAKAEKQAAQARAEAAALLEKQAIDADKKRDQSYEDELRRMEIEEKKIALEEKKAKAARANDYIDADLSRKNAETDVVKSTADANRNVSEGQKEMMTGVGKGAEAEGKNWFK